MATSLARITGFCTYAGRRSGISNGKEWAFNEATILVGGRETTTITLDDSMPTAREGDEVDYLVQVSPGRGDSIRIRAVADFPVTESAHSA